MKIRILLAGGLVCCGAALAWQTTPAEPTPNQQTRPPADQTTTPQTTTRSQTETSTPSTTTKTATPSASDTLPEIKTQTFKGTLVDASCAMGGSSGAGMASRTETAQPGTDQNASARGTSGSQTTGSEASTGTGSTGSTKASGDSNRAASGDACGVSASTTRFALKMKDGKTIPFDSVGNERAQLAIKNKKKWTEAAQAGKTVNAKVSGAMSGEKLTVVSIN
jgi:hypothetical protein